MKNDKNRIIEVELSDGEKVDGIILFTFEVNGDNFVIYELQKKLFAAKVDYGGQLRLVDKDEWFLVEKVYNEFIETMENKNE